LPYSTEPKRWRTGARPFSLRSSEGWLNTEYDWIETLCGALLQKSLLLHGYLAVLLGRERRFFFEFFLHDINMYPAKCRRDAYLSRSFVVRFSMVYAASP
jgi:hypothetical protein